MLESIWLLCIYVFPDNSQKHDFIHGKWLEHGDVVSCGLDLSEDNDVGFYQKSKKKKWEFFCFFGTCLMKHVISIGWNYRFLFQVDLKSFTKTTFFIKFSAKMFHNCGYNMDRWTVKMSPSCLFHRQSSLQITWIIWTVCQHFQGACLCLSPPAQAWSTDRLLKLFNLCSKAIMHLMKKKRK